MKNIKKYIMEIMGVILLTMVVDAVLHKVRGQSSFIYTLIIVGVISFIVNFVVSFLRDYSQKK